MAKEKRRDNLCIEAFDPASRQPCLVQFSQRRLMTIAKWGLWAVKEASEIVPTILQNPRVVFEGLRRDEDEDPRGVGWRCYCGKPSKKFIKDGSEANADPNQLFLVFVNDEGVAYNWRWEYADLENPDFRKVSRNDSIKRCTMQAMTNAEFAAQVAELAREAGPPQATAVYDPDGDSIEFLSRPEPFYAQRIDDLVTVYYSQESREVIGSLIKGASRFCSEILKRLPGFRIEVIDGNVRLEHIFQARLWSREHDSKDLATITYRKLIQVAEETGVKVEGAEQLCTAA